MANKDNSIEDFTFENFLIWKLVQKMQPIPRWTFTDKVYKEKFKEMARRQYELAIEDEKQAVEHVSSY